MAAARFLLFAALLAFLEGCASSTSDWSAKTVSAPMALPVAATAMQSPRCRSLPQTVAIEANAETPIDVLQSDGPEALSAALIASEARKNHQLKKAIDAYEKCRRLSSSASSLS